MAAINFSNIKVPSSGGAIDPNNANLGPLDIISALLPYAYAIAGLALLVYLLTGGLALMTSKGDPKAIQMAQGKITTALIGFIIIILAYVLTGLIGKLLGINTITTYFGG